VITAPPGCIDPRSRDHLVLRAAISRRQVLAGAGVGSLALLIAACGGGTKGGPTGAATTAESVAAGGGKEVDVVNWGLSSDIVGFDPVQAWDYATSPVIMSLDTLVRLGKSGVSVEPNIATSWKQESPTRYVYTIRDGVKFHDGTTLTAQDVAYGLNRHLDPMFRSKRRCSTCWSTCVAGSALPIWSSHTTSRWSGTSSTMWQSCSTAASSKPAGSTTCCERRITSTPAG
jgi:ABC-type transport system substrate-binding protein